MRTPTATAVRLVVPVALALVAALLVPLRPASAAVMDPALCARPVLYTLAGSGQSGGSAEMDEVVRRTREVAGKALIHVPVSYPAVPWWRYADRIGAAPTYYGLLDSEQVGVDRLLDVALRALNGCPGRTLLMAGYSQGADVVSRAVRLMAPSQQQRVSVALLGNPSFVGGLPSSRGTGASTGLRGLWPTFGRPSFRLPAAVQQRTFDVCLKGDAICNFRLPDVPSLAPPGRSAHYTYVRTGMAEQAAKAIWRMRAPHRPNPPPGPTPTPDVPKPPVPLRQVVLEQGPAIPSGYRYAVTLRGFPPASAVEVTCHDSADPGGFSRFTLTTDGAGSAFTASACYSGDGPEHWVVAGGVTSDRVVWGGAPPPPPPPRTWTQTAGGVVNTWTDWRSAGGTAGPRLQAGQSVQVSCRLTGFRVANGNTWWYRLASSPWEGRFYASADAFYNNGATSGSLVGTPWVDEAVAPC